MVGMQSEIMAAIAYGQQNSGQSDEIQWQKLTRIKHKLNGGNSNLDFENTNTIFYQEARAI